MFGYNQEATWSHEDGHDLNADEMRKCKEKKFELVRGNPNLIVGIPPDHWDKELVLLAAQNNQKFEATLATLKTIMQYEEFGNDQDIVQMAVQNHGLALEFVNSSLRDSGTIKLAVAQNYKALQFVPSDVLRNEKFALEIVLAHRKTLPYFKSFHQNEDFVRAFCKACDGSRSGNGRMQFMISFGLAELLGNEMFIQSLQSDELISHDEFTYCLNEIQKVQENEEYTSDMKLRKIVEERERDKEKSHAKNEPTRNELDDIQEDTRMGSPESGPDYFDMVETYTENSIDINLSRFTPSNNRKKNIKETTFAPKDFNNQILSLPEVRITRSKDKYIQLSSDSSDSEYSDNYNAAKEREDRDIPSQYTDSTDSEDVTTNHKPNKDLQRSRKSSDIELDKPIKESSGSKEARRVPIHSVVPLSEKIPRIEQNAQTVSTYPRISQRKSQTFGPNSATEEIPSLLSHSIDIPKRLRTEISESQLDFNESNTKKLKFDVDSVVDTNDELDSSYNGKGFVYVMKMLDGRDQLDVFEGGFNKQIG
jgi:hypothetical protein